MNINASLDSDGAARGYIAQDEHSGQLEDRLSIFGWRKNSVRDYFGYCKLLRSR